MQQLLRPGIAFLNLLRYPQKFALIALLLLVPVVLSIGLLYSETIPQLEFTRKERAGVRYIRHMNGLFVSIQESQRALYANDRAKVTRLIPAMSEALQELRKDSVAADLFQTQPILDQLEADQHRLRDLAAQGHSVELDTVHFDFLKHIQEEIARIGDVSNLILDPEITTYYLMDLTVIRSPERYLLLSEALSTLETIQATKQGSVELMTDVTKRENSLRYTSLATRLEANLAATKKGVETAIVNDPSLVDVLRQPLTMTSVKLERLITDFNNLSVYDNNVALVELARQENQQAYTASIDLWNHGLDALETRLDQRIQILEVKNRVAEITTLLVTLVVLYLLVAFYFSTMHAVRALDAASRGLRGGDVQVRVQTRDELGQVVKAFNRVARALAEENQERQRAEAERTELQEEIIRAQHATLDELSVPLIPLNETTVLLPLIGMIDSRRAQQILDTLLNGVASYRAQHVVIDMSGVKVVDTHVARTLVDAATGVRLLGAQVALAGIRAEVAQTLSHLGVDLRGVTFYASLQEAVLDLATVL